MYNDYKLMQYTTVPKSYSDGYEARTGFHWPAHMERKYQDYNTVFGACEHLLGLQMFFWTFTEPYGYETIDDVIAAMVANNADSHSLYMMEQYQYSFRHYTRTIFGQRLERIDRVGSVQLLKDLMNVMNINKVGAISGTYPNTTNVTVEVFTSDWEDWGSPFVSHGMLAPGQSFNNVNDDYVFFRYPQIV